MGRDSSIRFEGDDYKDVESDFAAFRSELERGARRARILFTGIALGLLLFILLWPRP